MALQLQKPTRGDVVAGISVALVLIPQALAYADLAGLPPVHGLYAAAAAPIAGAIVGSSPYLQTGPVALTSLLTFGALSPLALDNTASFATHAALLAILVGAIRLILGLARWGAISYFMSQPVVTGFTAAAAMLIVSSQIPSLTGAEGDSHNPFVAAGEALSQPGEWSVAAILVGLATIAIVLVGRRFNALVPWILVATVAGLLLSGTGAIHVNIVGDIPSEMLAIDLGLPWGSVPELVIPAAVIAVVGFAEPASISRRYATQDRTRWDPDKEFIGQGLANVAAGAVSGYPAGGSFSRSALNRMSGARTRWSGAITGLVVLAVLPFAGVLAELPMAVLAGLIILAAISLIDGRPFRDYWRQSRPQFLVAIPTFVVTLIAAPRVERGLFVGIALAMIVHLWRETFVEVEAWRESDTLHVRPRGVLYFASAPALEARLTTLLAEHQDATAVVFELQRLGRLDLTGLYVLRDVIDHTRDAGVIVTVHGVPPHAAERARSVLGPIEPLHS